MSEQHEKSNFFDTPAEDLQDGSFSAFLNNIRNDPNNMSNWLPAILPREGEARLLDIPRTVIIPVPDDIVEAFFMEDQSNDLARVIRFVTEHVQPKRMEAGFYPNVFVKNGSFSDKFNFRLCTPGPEPTQMALNLATINYDAICLDAGGFTEVVLRECIPYLSSATPCIYNGMPLRTEFRVFYDFDSHEPLYVVNYWDWEYCHEAIERNRTDSIVYKAVYPSMLEKYMSMKDEVVAAVAHDMENVTGLKGIWSVDVMLAEMPQTEYTEASSKLYLIDMAVARQSAYWDPDKAKTGEGGTA